MNRLCGSGLEAINQAGRAVETEHGDLFVAGGVESMTRGPWSWPKARVPFQRGDVTVYDSSLGWRFPNSRMGELYSLINNGETAENVAEKYQIIRKDQDELALGSHQKAIKAQQEGRLKDEIMPVEIPQRKGAPIIHDKDEGPRADTSLKSSLRYRPRLRKAERNGGKLFAAFRRGGGAACDHTAKGGTTQAQTVGSHRRFGRGRSSSQLHGHGPIPATQKALKRAGLTIDQIDLVEMNEAFASQILACVRELDIPLNKLNVNGGAIALGHPLGCSGARVMTTLIHEMQKRGSRYGLATMCIGVARGLPRSSKGSAELKAPDRHNVAS